MTPYVVRASPLLITDSWLYIYPFFAPSPCFYTTNALHIAHFIRKADPVVLANKSNKSLLCSKMAPPPPANKSMSERFIALAQTLQFAWFAGHLTLLSSVMFYGVSYFRMRYYGRWAQLNYRTAFVAAAATYGIVVYKAYRARMKSGKAQGGTGGALQLAADENVQYLGKPQDSIRALGVA